MVMNHINFAQTCKNAFEKLVGSCFHNNETKTKMKIIKKKLKMYNKVVSDMKELQAKGFDVSASLVTIENKTRKINEKIHEIENILVN